MIESEEEKQMVERLRIGINKMFGKKLSDEEIELDYLLIVHDEIEGETIPEFVLDVLADPIAAIGYGFRDKNNDFFAVCHLYYVGPDPYEVWLKNDVVITNPLE